MSLIKPGTIFGLGNPLLDITASVDAEFLAKFDLKANDAILSTEKHEKLGDVMRQNYPVKYTAGGSCQNTMRVAQWVLNSTPKACVFMGCVGDDFYGECMSKKAAEDNVQTLYRVDEKLPTGHCCVLVTDNGKNRSLVANLAAANAFQKDHLLENWTAVESARLIYTTGFHLTVCPPAMIELAEHVHASEEPKLFAFNLSAPFLMQFFSTPLEQVMPYVDVLFCNDTEAREYAKLQKWPETETIEKIASRIANLPRRTPTRSRVVVITQDCEPVLLSRSANLTANQNEQDLLRTPIHKLPAESIVDTNGAGDAFAGGFVAQLARNDLSLELDSLKRCVAVGNICAGEIIQQDGCSIPAKPFKH